MEAQEARKARFQRMMLLQAKKRKLNEGSRELEGNSNLTEPQYLEPNSSQLGNPIAAGGNTRSRPLLEIQPGSSQINAPSTGCSQTTQNLTALSSMKSDQALKARHNRYLLLSAKRRRFDRSTAKENVEPTNMSVDHSMLSSELHKYTHGTQQGNEIEVTDGDTSTVSFAHQTTQSTASNLQEEHTHLSSEVLKHNQAIYTLIERENN